jgi:hypothetical protein
MEFLKEEQHVDSKETFIRFMDALRLNWDKNHELIRRECRAETKTTGSSWKNCCLPDFLEAMQTWIADSKQLPSDFPYKDLASILSAATRYQGCEIESGRLQSQRLNCWDVMKCGREVGGSKVDELGVCPASTWDKDGEMNGGIHGGRICWVLVGTLCGDKVQGTFAEKIRTCLKCKFYQYVRQQEGKNFRYTLPQKK